MVRTTLGAEVSTEVTVAGSESVDFLRVRETGNVSGGTTERTNVRAPAGRVYELLGLRFDVSEVSSTASGQHLVQLQSESESIRALSANSSGSDDVTYTASNFESATSSQSPSTDVAQLLAPRGLRADDTNGYQFSYSNLTGSTQTGARTYRLWVREIKVG